MLLLSPLTLPARWRLLLGTLALPPVFLLRSRVEGLVLLALLWLASRLVGYRLWWRKLLPMILGLLLFYLFLPKGEVLWRFRFPWGGVFHLTVGALFEGAMTVLFLIQLLLLSGFSVGRDLRLPGRWGRQVARTLGFYHVLLQRSGELSLTRPFASLDRLLLTAEREWARSDSGQQGTEWTGGGAEDVEDGTKWKVAFYLAVLVIPCWLLVLTRW